MLSYNDIKLITEAIEEVGDTWTNPKIEPVKRKIKNYYRAKLNEQCCYCRKNFEGEFNMVIDIEHILPKGKFEKYMFIPLNLSIACKRCNMNVKNEDTSFIISELLIETSPFDTNNYKFIHPNLDDYFTNLYYLVQICNNDKIIKYKPITDKGSYTYDYFRLKELEIESLNKVQGIISESLSEDISPEITNEINTLLKNK